MSKPTSILETKLTESQQAQLADWLLSGVPYHQAAAMVEKEFGLKVSISAFSRFYQSNCSAALLARRMRAVKLADEVAAEARSHPGQFTAATIDQLSQKAFELASSPGANPQDVKALFSLVLKSRDQDLDVQRLKLDREKFEVEIAEKLLSEELQRKAREIADSNLSNADKIAAMRQAAFADVDAFVAAGKLVIPKS